MSPLGDYLDARDAGRAADAQRQAANPAWQPNVRTKAPDALVDELLADLNVSFYTGGDAKAWLRDLRDLKLVLTWPATWLTQRGIGLPGDRYEAILREIIAGVKEHGDKAAIRHFPTYFGHVVRQWFIHHGEELYEERKRARTFMEAALRTATQRAVFAEPDPTEALAAAHRVLATGKRAAKAPHADQDQMTLL